MVWWEIHHPYFGAEEHQSQVPVTHDSNNEVVSTVLKMNGKSVHFNMYKYGIYYHDMRNHHFTLAQNLNENEASYSQINIKDAKLES